MRKIGINMKEKIQIGSINLREVQSFPEKMQLSWNEVYWEDKCKQLLLRENYGEMNSEETWLYVSYEIF